METVTAVITYAPQHRELVDAADNSIRPQVDEVLIVHDWPKLGQAARLNELIQRAKSDWICFQDADDRSLFDRIAIARPYFPVSDLIYTDTDKHKAQHFDLETFKKNRFVPFPTILVRRDIALEIPLPEHIGHGNDYVWLRRVYSKYKRFTYIPLATVIYSTETSTYRKYGRIPVLRKIKRLLYYRKLERLI